MIPPRFVTAAAAAALLGLGVAACGTQAAGGGAQSPQAQHLAGTASPRVTAAPLQLSPVYPKVPTWAQVTLAGSLPASGPATGAVFRVPGGVVPAAAVQALASALRLSGALRRVAGGWRVVGQGTLQISDAEGEAWTFTGPLALFRPCGPVVQSPLSSGTTGLAPRAAEGTGLLCPMKPGQLEPNDQIPVPIGGPPSAAAAHAAAEPVLQAVGLAGAPLRTETIGSYTFVSADPTVDGLPTAGFATTIGVGPGDRILRASGWLAQPVPGSAYPLISAGQAVNLLEQSTHPAAHPPELMCPLNPDVLCGPGTPVRAIAVTGAVYGLALGYSRGRPLLVPSWLFSIAGRGLRVPETAVSPRYLTG